jgi:hypothetical protein
MRTWVLTPDWKVTQVLDLAPVRPDEVEACKRVCVAHNAADVLDRLGLA